MRKNVARLSRSGCAYIIDGLVYGNNRYRLNETWRCTDLLIKVEVQEYGLLEFDKYEQIIDAGYRAAQEQMAGWKG